MPESVIKRYYDGLGEGRLIAAKCECCGSYTFPPTTACENCGCADLDWVELSGKGKLLFVTHGMAPPPNPRFNEIAPLTYGHVILEEGIVVQGIVNGVEPTPEALREFYERGPVDVRADVIKVKELNVLAFTPV